MARERRSSRLLSLIAALALPLGALAQEIRLGNEVQINTYTSNNQAAVSVAADADGDFVVVWGSYTQDGANSGVFGRRFSSAGAPQASEFQVNTLTTGNQNFPSVAVTAGGAFIVAWNSAGDGSDYGISARRFSSTGVPQSSEFLVNSTITGAQKSPSVAVSASGAFVIAWVSPHDGDYSGVFARRFSNVGTPQASEFQVNTFTTQAQLSPSVSSDADGDFVIAWQSNVHQDGSYAGIFARRFSSAGVRLASEFQVNAITTNNQSDPSVAADTDGDFVVAWHSYVQDGSDYGIFARRFSSAGALLVSELQVNTYTTSGQTNASVAADADGDFVVAWASFNQDGSNRGVFARRFSSAGVRLASEFQVNTYTANTQEYPSVAASASGDFVVAWSSELQDGSSRGVFAQRFASPAILDIDGNGSVTALSDGILALRFMFGFTGTTLTNGVVGAGCTRCDAAAIEPYLQTLI